MTAGDVDLDPDLDLDLDPDPDPDPDPDHDHDHDHDLDPDLDLDPLLPARRARTCSHLGQRAERSAEGGQDSSGSRLALPPRMTFRLWAAYALLEIGLSFTPGPAVFTVVGQALRHGWRRSAFGALGIAAGNLVYFGLSALGIGAFLAASPRLYAAFRWGGLAYLAVAGLRLLTSRPGAPGPVASAEGQASALFAQGLATQLANPKAIVFFASFLAPFLDPAAAWPVPTQMAVYAATTTAAEVPILVLYGLAASRGGALLPAGKLGQWQDRIAGGCLLAVAAWLGLRG